MKNLRPLIVSIIFSALACNAQEIPTYYISPMSKSGAPSMPSLSFNLDTLGGRQPFVFKTYSEHKRRGNKDNLFLRSPEGVDNWNINKDTRYKIFGGVAEIQTADNKAVKKFKIRGKNPVDGDAQKFIKSICKEHWYATAIARHESRQGYFVFNQFNSQKCKKTIVGIPNCGLPDGW